MTPAEARCTPPRAGAVLALALAGIVATLASCCPDDTAIRVSVRGVPTGTDVLHVTLTLDGRPSQPIADFPHTDTLLGLRLPGGSQGELVLTVQARSAASQCYIATAQVGATLGGACSADLDVVLAPTSPAACPVTVTRTGQGTVTSVPAGINCGSACAADFRLGSALALTARPSPGWYFAHWSQPCAQRTDCVVDVGAAQRLSAVFGAVPASLSFGMLRTITAPAVIHDLAIGDFNRDGKGDVAVAHDEGLTIYNGDASASLSMSMPLTEITGMVSRVLAGPLGRKQAPEDLAMLEMDPATMDYLLTTVLFPPGRPMTINRSPLGRRAIDLAMGDLNGDGYEDVAVALDNATVFIFPNGPAGLQPPLTVTPRFIPAVTPAALTAGDYDGDGKDDLALLTQVDAMHSAVTLLLSRQAMDRPLERMPYLLGRPGSGMASGDLNGDGYADLVALHPATEEITRLLLGSDVTKYQATRVSAGGTPEAALVADLQRDGKPELLVLLRTDPPTSSTGVGVYAGSGPLDSMRLLPALDQATRMVAGDLQGDGKPDLVTGGPTGPQIGVLLNTSR